MEADSNFDISRFVYPDSGVLPVANDIYESLSGINNVLFTNRKFYVPKKEIAKGWTQKLEEKYGIEPYFCYDSEIRSLPIDLSLGFINEMNGKRREDLKKLKIALAEASPESLLKKQEELSSEEALHVKKRKLQTLFLFTDEETAKKRYENLNDFEKRVLSWHPGYGYLVSANEVDKGLISKMKTSTLKNKLEKEYFFSVPNSYWSGIILSVGQEPETDRIYWGLKRDIVTEWPFNMEKIPEGMAREDAEITEMLAPIENFMSNMNYLTFNVESVLENL